MNKLLSVSIVCYNSPEDDLERVLKCLLSSNLDMDIYISDNSPTNKLGQFFSNYPVKYIFNNKNVGYGAGHNIVIMHRSITYKYHLVLNADIYFEKDALSNLCSFMDEHEEYVHVMPQIRYPDGSIQKLCRQAPSYTDIFLKRFIQPFFKSVGSKYESSFDYSQQHENIPFLSGCFMLIRSDVLLEMKGFDEKIFLYFEDADLTMRIRYKYKNVYYPKVVVYHEYKRGTAKSLKHIRFALKGLLIYQSKHKLNLQ